MSKNKIFLRAFIPSIFIVFLIFLNSCAVTDWFQGKISDEEVADLDKGLKAENKKTPFDDSFREFGAMLQAYDIPPAPIQSKNIGNETAEKGLPSDLYTMIATSINKIGNQVIFIPYDAQYVVSEATTGGRITRIFPDVVIAGAMTGYDKDLIEKEREGEIEGAWAGAQGAAKYDVQTGVSRLGLDLNMLDYQTQVYFPRIQATNSILLRKDKFGWGVSAYYMGCGGSLDSSVKTQQGVHMALRILVEFSVLELLGKYFNVPYWKCIKGANPDEAMIKRLHENFCELAPDRQILFLKKYLFLHGYKGLNRTNETLTSEEQQSVSRAMRQYGCSNNADVLIKLWENLDVNAAKEIVIRDRRQKMLEELRMASEREKEAKIAAQQEAERKVREEAELREKQALFGNLISSADKLLSEKKLDKAKTEYENASKIAPEAPYPKEQIAKINNLLAALKAEEETYAAAVASGDSFFKSKEFEKAKMEYEKAAKIKPKEEYIIKKLEEVNELLSFKKPSGVGKIDEKEWTKDGL